MRIPLANRIKRKSHRDIAFAQDIVVEELLKVMPRAVFHGGTCIWRCYGGKRFSEDLDFYFPKNKKLVLRLFEALEKKGFIVLKKKISERSVYSEMKYGRVFVRLEATFQNIIGELLDYEKLDGSLLTIYGLSAADLLDEKITAYLKRGKIRDIYDIFFLLRKITDLSSINPEIKKVFRDGFIPSDLSNLRVLILEGVVPRFDELKQYIRKKWESKNI